VTGTCEDCDFIDLPALTSSDQKNKEIKKLPSHLRASNLNNPKLIKTKKKKKKKKKCSGSTCGCTCSLCAADGPVPHTAAEHSVQAGVDLRLAELGVLADAKDEGSTPQQLGKTLVTLAVTLTGAGRTPGAGSGRGWAALSSRTARVVWDWTLALIERWVHCFVFPFFFYSISTFQGIEKSHHPLERASHFFFFFFFFFLFSIFPFAIHGSEQQIRQR
jgi:hypothetical protein